MKTIDLNEVVSELKKLTSTEAMKRKGANSCVVVEKALYNAKRRRESASYMEHFDLSDW